MLNFKNYYKINETVNLLKSSLHDKQIVFLGKMAWWSVYSEVETKVPLQRIINIEEYRELIGNSYLSRDNIADNPEPLKQMFEKCAWSLSSLGFPKMHQVVILKDLDKDYNIITGSAGNGGAAYRKEHGLLINRNQVRLYVLIHEHAHAYWFNLPKVNKQFFVKYYEKIKNHDNYDLMKVWNYKHKNKKAKFEDQDLERGWDIFKNVFETFNIKNNEIITIDGFLNLKKALETQDEQKIIEAAVFPYKGSKCNVKLKQDLNYKFKKGNLVLLEKYDDYIISTIGRKSFEDEYPKPIKNEDIFDLVEFNLDYLNDYQKEIFHNSMKLSKIKQSSFFASKDKKDIVTKAFEDSIDMFINYIKLDDAKIEKNNINIKNIFNTWSSIISKRFANQKIKSIDDLKKAYIDTLKIKLNIRDFTPDFSKEKNKPWDTSDMSHWRNAASDKKFTVSSYGAANIDELWATTVEYAALGVVINPELKKLIYKTINGF